MTFDQLLQQAQTLSAQVAGKTAVFWSLDRGVALSGGMET
jgi:hypothetical protein